MKPLWNGAGLLRGAGALFICVMGAGAQTREDGTAHYYRGRLAQAAKAFEAAAQADAQDAAARLDGAVVLRELGDHAASYRMFSEAALLLPDDADATAAAGWAAQRAGLIEEARAAYASALKSDDKHPQALLGLARLELAQENAETALKLCEKLTAAKPEFTLGHILKARAHSVLKQEKEAARAFELAFDSDWTYAEVRQWLGPVYISLERFNDAWRQYVRILSVSPLDKPARAARDKLAKLITQTPEELLPEKKLKEHLPVVSAEPHAKMPHIRVGIGTTVRGTPAAKHEVAFLVSGPFELFDPDTGKVLAEGPGGQAWRGRRMRERGSWAYEILDADGNRRASFKKVLAVRPKDLVKDSTIVQRLDLASGTGWQAQGDRQLKGIVELRGLGSSGLYLVNEIGLEDYIYGVINEEMPVKFPEEALKSQAVIARNHALVTQRNKHHKRYHYELCDGQHCQVYSGVGGEAAKGRKVVDETRGLILTHEGRTAQTPYSSNCGGHTQSSGEIPNWFAAPYLQGRRDDADGPSHLKSPWELELWLKTTPDVFCGHDQFKRSSQFRWSRVIDAAGLEERLAKRKPGFGKLKGIRIIERSQSGNANKIEFQGSKRNYIVDREHLVRNVLGLGSVRSTMFLLELDKDAEGRPTEIWMYGGGWGHGVGLCQIGAAGRAHAKQSFKEILEHYFPGTVLTVLGY